MTMFAIVGIAAGVVLALLGVAQLISLGPPRHLVSTVVLGTSLGADPTSAAGGDPRITSDGIPALGVARRTAAAPCRRSRHPLATSGGIIAGQLQVLNPYGATATFPVPCA